jgi:hypothetical protein
MNKCCGCEQEFEEELTKVRIDYPDGEDWEAFEPRWFILLKSLAGTKKTVQRQPAVARTKEHP